MNEVQRSFLFFNLVKLRKCSFFTAEQEGRSVVPHVECYPLLRDWLLSGACHGAGYVCSCCTRCLFIRGRDWLLSRACHGAVYMLVLHVVLVHSR